MPTQPTKSLTPETDAKIVEVEQFMSVNKMYSDIVDHSRSLELRLNAALKHIKNNQCGHSAKEIIDWRNQLKIALAENEELRKDKERLNNLEKLLMEGERLELGISGFRFIDFTATEISSSPQLRQAIDSAVQSTNKPK